MKVLHFILSAVNKEIKADLWNFILANTYFIHFSSYKLINSDEINIYVYMCHLNQF